MSIWNNYHLAHTIQDALQVLSAHPAPARIIAGGTDLLLDLQQDRHPPVDLLVDVTAIPELNCLEIRQAELFIGAAVPLRLVTGSPLVRQHARALQEASALIGGPQVRNTATLGGNVAHALPAADGTIALTAVNAQVEVASLEGIRRVPVLDLFVGPGQSSMDAQHDLLVGFYLPLVQPGQSSAFARVMRPQGVAIAILNMAVWLERAENRIVDLRVSLGPAGLTPRRSETAEKILRGQPLTPDLAAQAARGVLADARFRTSPHRSTADYRKHLSRVLLDQVLQTAWNRAGGREES